MTPERASPLRRRMIEDMSIRRFGPKTQHDHVRVVAAFARFLGRSPDLAEPEDLRRYQLHLAAESAAPAEMNASAVEVTPISAAIVVSGRSQAPLQVGGGRMHTMSREALFEAVTRGRRQEIQLTAARGGRDPAQRPAPPSATPRRRIRSPTATPFSVHQATMRS